MSFVVHKKVAGTMTGGEKASWAIQETITGFYTYTHMHAYRALAGYKCFSERKQIRTSLTMSGDPQQTFAASAQLRQTPCFSFRNMYISSLFKSLLSRASASRHGQQPVPPHPPCTRKQVCKIQGEAGQPVCITI